MDDATANNLLARLEQLERENKLLKQWAARLKERLDKPEPAKAITGVSRGQRALNWGMVVGLVFLGLNVVVFHSQFDSMRAYVSTKELLIKNEDGDMGITLSNSKEHGPRLFMYDKMDYMGGQMTGAKRIALAVTKDGRPSLSLFKTMDKPKPLGAGPVGIHLGISEGEHTQVYLNGPTGKDAIYLGTKPKPILEISDEDGRNLIRLP
jgi:hypothetical protein